MCHQATKLAGIAAASNEAYTIYMENLKELSKKLLEVHEQQHTIVHQKKDDPCTEIHSLSSLLLDPNISQTKGRKKDSKKSGRLKSSIELAIGKKKRQCASCKKFGHDKRICPLNPNRRKIESSNLANERSELLRRGAIRKGVIGDGIGEEELLRRSDRNEELLRRGVLGGDFDGDDITDQILI
ncbi:hypothetical protein QYF36_023490 [Acer negundo]|nr:hypothetical protein QYF36_023490 [Acer negundo]